MRHFRVVTGFSSTFGWNHIDSRHHPTTMRAAEHGDINLKEVETSKAGLWQFEACVNSITKMFHTEKDVT